MQILRGLNFAFPKRMEALWPSLPLLKALEERVAARKNVANYLSSDRYIDFNEGVFRYYKELDSAK